MQLSLAVWGDPLQEQIILFFLFTGSWALKEECGETDFQPFAFQMNICHCVMRTNQMCPGHMCNSPKV